MDTCRILQVEHEDVADDDKRVKEEERVHADAVPREGGKNANLHSC
jgi:hypothetical protein